ncbi:MAG: hypothetical protein Q4C96_08600, partial [Planctomycetia bacterium]|nr:hypothetical protein [Planctomycetia bacterium]
MKFYFKFIPIFIFFTLLCLPALCLAQVVIDADGNSHTYGTVKIGGDDPDESLDGTMIENGVTVNTGAILNLTTGGSISGAVANSGT